MGTSSGRSKRVFSQQIDTYRKEGDLVKALEHARFARTQAPQSKAVRSSYAWVMYERIKQTVVRAREAWTTPQAYKTLTRAHKEASDIVKEYQQANLPKADLSFSLILLQLTRFPRPAQALYEFAKWGGPKGLRSEDHTLRREGERFYPSLIEQITQDISALIASRGDAAQCQYTLGLLNYTEREAEQIIDPQPLRRRRVTIARRAGALEEAERMCHTLLSENKNTPELWCELAWCLKASQPRRGYLLLVHATQVARACEYSELDAIPVYEDAARGAQSVDDLVAASALAWWASELRRSCGGPVPYGLVTFIRSLGLPSPNPKADLSELFDHARAESIAVLSEGEISTRDESAEDRPELVEARSLAQESSEEN